GGGIRPPASTPPPATPSARSPAPPAVSAASGSAGGLCSNHASSFPLPATRLDRWSGRGWNGALGTLTRGHWLPALRSGKSAAGSRKREAEANDDLHTTSNRAVGADDGS